MSETKVDGGGDGPEIKKREKSVINEKKVATKRPVAGEKVVLVDTEEVSDDVGDKIAANDLEKASGKRSDNDMKASDKLSANDTKASDRISPIDREKAKESIAKAKDSNTEVIDCLTSSQETLDPPYPEPFSLGNIHSENKINHYYRK